MWADPCSQVPKSSSMLWFSNGKFNNCMWVQSSCVHILGGGLYLISVILAIFWHAIDVSHVVGCLSQTVNVVLRQFRCVLRGCHGGHKTIMRQTERDRIQEPGTFLSLSGNSVRVCVCVCCNYSQGPGVEPSRSIVSLSVAWGGADLPSLLSSVLVTLWLALAPPDTPPHSSAHTQVLVGQLAACCTRNMSGEVFPMHVSVINHSELSVYWCSLDIDATSYIE